MDTLYAVTLIVAIAAGTVAFLASVLGLIRPDRPVQAHARFRAILSSHRLTKWTLGLAFISLATSVVVHSRWGHGPGTVAPMDLGQLLSAHEAFPTVGALLLVALVMAGYRSRRQRHANATRRAAFDREIALGKALIAAGELERGFKHPERAHVIGQAFVWAHSMAHWLMLKVEIRRRRVGAAFGQVVRLILGAIGSAVGVVPTGNTGGTDISMFKRLPIAPELQEVIRGSSPGHPES